MPNFWRTGRTLRQKLGNAYGPSLGCPAGRYALRLWRATDRLALRQLLEIDDAERRELKLRRGLNRFGHVRMEHHDTNFRVVTPRLPDARLPVGLGRRAKGSLQYAKILESVAYGVLVDALFTAEKAAAHLDTSKGHHSAIKSAGNILVHFDFASTSRPRMGVEDSSSESVLSLMEASSFPAVQKELKAQFLANDAVVTDHALAAERACAATGRRPAPPWLRTEYVKGECAVAARAIQALFRRGLAVKGCAARRLENDVDRGNQADEDALAKTKSKAGKASRKSAKSKKKPDGASLRKTLGGRDGVASAQASVASVGGATAATAATAGTAGTGAAGRRRSLPKAEESIVETLGEGSAADGFDEDAMYEEDSGWVVSAEPLTLEQLAARRAKPIEQKLPAATSSHGPSAEATAGVDE